MTITSKLTEKLGMASDPENPTPREKAKEAAEVVKNLKLEDTEFVRRQLRETITDTVAYIPDTLEMASSSQDADLYHAAASLIRNVGDLCKKLADLDQKDAERVSKEIRAIPAPDSKESITAALPAPEKAMTAESFLHTCEVEDIEFEEID